MAVYSNILGDTMRLLNNCKETIKFNLNIVVLIKKLHLRQCNMLYVIAYTGYAT